MVILYEMSLLSGWKDSKVEGFSGNSHSLLMSRGTTRMEHAVLGPPVSNVKAEVIEFVKVSLLFGRF